MEKCIGVKKVHQTNFRGVKLEEMEDGSFYLSSEYGCETFYKKPTKEDIRLFVDGCIDRGIKI